MWIWAICFDTSDVPVKFKSQPSTYFLLASQRLISRGYPLSSGKTIVSVGKDVTSFCSRERLWWGCECYFYNGPNGWRSNRGTRQWRLPNNPLAWVCKNNTLVSPNSSCSSIRSSENVEIIVEAIIPHCFVTPSVSVTITSSKRPSYWSLPRYVALTFDETVDVGPHHHHTHQACLPTQAS